MKYFIAALGFVQKLSFNLISVLSAHKMVILQTAISCFRHELWCFYITWFPVFFYIQKHRENFIKINRFFFFILPELTVRAAEAPSAERYVRKRKLHFPINLFSIEIPFPWVWLELNLEVKKYCKNLKTSGKKLSSNYGGNEETLKALKY